MQRSFCPGDVRCPEVWAGYGDLTGHRRIPFGDLAAEPCPGDGRRGSPADRRSLQRGLRRRVAARGVAMPGLSIRLRTGRSTLVVGTALGTWCAAPVVIGFHAESRMEVSGRCY